jgi:anhydro-N-acetylmuramic acid kinase
MHDHAWMVGVMSGSSLDGLDIVLVDFNAEGTQESFIPYKYKILKAHTVPLPEELQSALKILPQQTCMHLSQVDRKYGAWIGETLKTFIGNDAEKITAVGVHGHTAWHHPEEGTSMQIGHGAYIAAESGLPVVTDFRNNDIALGGQGAPMVGLSEQKLWSGYDAYLNLGGICNISFNLDGRYLSQDINICNQLLNHLANLKGAKYDPYGDWAKSGKIIEPLLSTWLNHPHFNKKGPKSLDNSFLQNHILNNLAPYATHSIEDQLRTAVELISITIQRALSEISNEEHERTILCTGGGAYNSFLVDQIKRINGWRLILPEDQVIEYKEAIMVAFSALLRWYRIPNFNPEATGAFKGAIGGAVYFP